MKLAFILQLVCCVHVFGVNVLEGEYVPVKFPHLDRKSCYDECNGFEKKCNGWEFDEACTIQLAAHYSAPKLYHEDTEPELLQRELCQWMSGDLSCMDPVVGTHIYPDCTFREEGCFLRCLDGCVLVGSECGNACQSPVFGTFMTNDGDYDLKKVLLQTGWTPEEIAEQVTREVVAYFEGQGFPMEGLFIVNMATDMENGDWRIDFEISPGRDVDWTPQHNMIILFDCVTDGDCFSDTVTYPLLGYLTNLGCTDKCEGVTNAPNACTGVVCPPAADDCHMQGTCFGGDCSTPLAPANTPCTDEDNFTGQCDGFGSCDLCRGVTCTLEDPNALCRVPGACQDANGACSGDVNASENTPCGDAGLCQVNGVCDLCGEVTCPSTECQDIRTCTNGICSDVENLTLGTPCTDENNFTGQCDGFGVCDLCAGVTCTLEDPNALCKVPGACQASDGECSADVNALENTQCGDDGLCQSDGVCDLCAEVSCPSTECQANRRCSDGTCSDIENLTEGTTCPVTPGKTCDGMGNCDLCSNLNCNPANNDCINPGMCNPETGMCEGETDKSSGELCGRGQCDGSGTCVDMCVQNNNEDCSGLVTEPECQEANVCDPQVGSCPAPTAINDGQTCSDAIGTGTCDNGICVIIDQCINTTCEQPVCREVGVCDPFDGSCTPSNMKLADFTPCSDISVSSGACVDGVCTDLCAGVGVCPDPPKCHIDTGCDSETGHCGISPDAGASCSGANIPCGTGTCIGFECQEGECSAIGECEFTARDDGAACQGRDGTCLNGICDPCGGVDCTNALPCHLDGQCENGVCSNNIVANTQQGDCDSGSFCWDGECQDNPCEPLNPCTTTNPCIDQPAMECTSFDDNGALSFQCTQPHEADDTPCPAGVCRTGQCVPVQQGDRNVEVYCEGTVENTDSYMVRSSSNEWTDFSTGHSVSGTGAFAAISAISSGMNGDAQFLAQCTSTVEACPNSPTPATCAVWEIECTSSFEVTLARFSETTKQFPLVGGFSLNGLNCLPQVCTGSQSVQSVGDPGQKYKGVEVSWEVNNIEQRIELELDVDATLAWMGMGVSPTTVPQMDDTYATIWQINSNAPDFIEGRLTGYGFIVADVIGAMTADTLGGHENAFVDINNGHSILRFDRPLNGGGEMPNIDPHDVSIPIVFAFSQSLTTVAYHGMDRAMVGLNVCKNDMKAPSFKWRRGVYEYEADDIDADLTTLFQQLHDRVGQFVRMGFHDAATHQVYDNTGGTHACMMWETEGNDPDNNGLDKTQNLLSTMKDKHPEMSMADLFHHASAQAIQHTGGPDTHSRFGRVDCIDDDGIPATQHHDGLTYSRLPQGQFREGLNNVGIPACPSSNAGDNVQCSCSTQCWNRLASHTRDFFFRRIGFSDITAAWIVLQAGGHAIGCVHEEHSGFKSACWTPEPETWDQVYLDMMENSGSWVFSQQATGDGRRLQAFKDVPSGGQAMHLMTDTTMVFFQRSHVVSTVVEHAVLNDYTSVNPDGSDNPSGMINFNRDFSKFYQELVEFDQVLAYPECNCIDGNGANAEIDDTIMSNGVLISWGTSNDDTLISFTLRIDNPDDDWVGLGFEWAGVPNFFPMSTGIPSGVVYNPYDGLITERPLSVGGVLPPHPTQRISHFGYDNSNGVTTLRFTIPVANPNEQINLDDQILMYARGSCNKFGVGCFHTLEGWMVVELNSCRGSALTPPPPVNTPVTHPGCSVSSTVARSDTSSITVEFSVPANTDTVDVTITVTNTEGKYVALGISDSNGGMANAEAIVWSAGTGALVEEFELLLQTDVFDDAAEKITTGNSFTTQMRTENVDTVITFSRNWSVPARDNQIDPYGKNRIVWAVGENAVHNEAHANSGKYRGRMVLDLGINCCLNQCV